jgi:hypothetical protein
MGNGFCLKTPNDDIFFVNCELEDSIDGSTHIDYNFDTNIYLNEPISVLEKAILEKKDNIIIKKNKKINTIHINTTEHNNIDKNKTLQDYYNISKPPSKSHYNILRNHILVR